VKVLLTLPPGFVAFNVYEVELMSSDGDPVIKPVEELNDKPAGSELGVNS
jgi:hypothetical protein